MFMLRSAFWLTVGFLLVAPHGTDFGAAAASVKNQAIAAGVEAGQQFIAQQILEAPLAASLVSQISSSPSVALPMQDSSTAALVFPRPRPAAMG